MSIGGWVTCFSLRSTLLSEAATQIIWLGDDKEDDDKGEYQDYCDDQDEVEDKVEDKWSSLLRIGKGWLFWNIFWKFIGFGVLKRSFCGKFKIFCGFWKRAKPVFRMYVRRMKTEIRINVGVSMIINTRRSARKVDRYKKGQICWWELIKNWKDGKCFESDRRCLRRLDKVDVWYYLFPCPDLIRSWFDEVRTRRKMKITFSVRLICIFIPCPVFWWSIWVLWEVKDI